MRSGQSTTQKLLTSVLATTKSDRLFPSVNSLVITSSHADPNLVARKESRPWRCSSCSQQPRWCKLSIQVNASRRNVTRLAFRKSASPGKWSSAIRHASWAQQEVVEPRATEYQRLGFERRVSKVAAIGNRLFEDYQRGHVLNIKDARALSKAFHDLEPFGWPGLTAADGDGSPFSEMRGLRKPLCTPHASRPAEFGTSLLGMFAPGTLRSQRIPATPESPWRKATETLTRRCTRFP